VRIQSLRSHRILGVAGISVGGAGAAEAGGFPGSVILNSLSSTSWMVVVRCRGRSPG
jgi:hypothetical protein